MPEIKTPRCPTCGEEIEGRIDKVFCDAHCKSAFHYKKKKAENTSFFHQVDLQLKQNRRLLKHFNQAGKATVRQEELHKAGFNPKFFTHYWKTKMGDVYLFCYDYGFLSRSENNKPKYVLVKWQEYMND